MATKQDYKKGREELGRWFKWSIVFGVGITLLCGILGALVGASMASEGSASAATAEPPVPTSVCATQAPLECSVTTAVSKGELFLIAIGLIAGGMLELMKVKDQSRPKGWENLFFALVTMLTISAIAWAFVTGFVAANEPLETYGWIAGWLGAGVLLFVVVAVGLCVTMSAITTVPGGETETNKEVKQQ
jgi:hypothetical protein